MDPLLVFRRTEAGDALAKRPRDIKIIEWRAVLLLVDGSMPLQTLQQRFGNALNVEAVLQAMRADGLIEPVPGDTPLSEDLPEPVNPSWFQAKEEQSEKKDVRPSTPAPQRTRADVRTRADIPIPPPEITLPPDHNPKRRPRRKPITSTMLVRAIVMGLLIAIIGAIYVLPETIRPDVERHLTQALGIPVAIGKADLSFARGPAIALHDVQIGTQPSIDIKTVLLEPYVQGMLSSRPLRAVIPDLVLKPTELADFSEAAQKLPSLGEIHFGSLRARALPLPPFIGDLQVGGNKAGTLSLRDESDGINIELSPNTQGLDFQVYSGNWKLPLFGGIPGTSIQLDGRLTDQILDVSRFTLGAYNGRIEGNARLVFDRDIHLDGRLRTYSCDLASLLGLLDPLAKTRGVVNADLRFTATGATFGTLDQLTLAGPVVLERGALVGIDIPTAISERSPKPVSGGETDFDTIKGELDYGAAGVEFQIQQFVSASMAGSGELHLDTTIPPALSGRMLINVSGSDRSLRAPAFLQGSLAHPSIQMSTVTIHND